MINAKAPLLEDEAKQVICAPDKGETRREAEAAGGCRARISSIVAMNDNEGGTLQSANLPLSLRWKDA